jgi:hypothetical protein
MITVKLLIRDDKTTAPKFVAKRVAPPVMPRFSKTVESEKSARQAGMPTPKDNPKRSAISRRSLSDEAENMKGMTDAAHPTIIQASSILALLIFFDKIAPTTLDMITVEKNTPLIEMLSSTARFADA